MEIGDKLYEDYRDENPEEFQRLQVEMAIACEQNGWCMEDGDEDGRRYLIINPPYEPTPEEQQEAIKQQLTEAVQRYMDTAARSRGYDGILSVCSYINTGNTKFDAEGEACRIWRSAVWAKCYEIMDNVLAGIMEIPTEEELIDMLPILTW